MIRPVSGRNPFVGSSVVIRHCSAVAAQHDLVLAQAEILEGLAGRDPQL